MAFIKGNQEIHLENFQCTGGVNQTVLAVPKEAGGTSWIIFNPHGADVWVNLLSGSVASPSAGILIPSGTSPVYDFCIDSFSTFAVATASLNVLYGVPSAKNQR